METQGPRQGSAHLGILESTLRKFSFCFRKPPPRLRPPPRPPPSSGSAPTPVPPPPPGSDDINPGGFCPRVLMWPGEKADRCRTPEIGHENRYENRDWKRKQTRRQHSTFTTIMLLLEGPKTWLTRCVGEDTCPNRVNGRLCLPGVTR
jgi:hypothetical protein